MKFMKFMKVMKPPLKDWSESMSEVFDELKKAEQQLRTIQIHWTYGENAKEHIAKAQLALVDIARWIDHHD